MADIIHKSKIQIRSTSFNSNGSTNSGDKTPTTPTTPSKLMINHGKPNFTLPRSAQKAQQNGDNDHEPAAVNGKNNNNNYNAFKTADLLYYSNNIVNTTKFNGTFNPTTMSATLKQVNQSDANDNEASKVVLRRAKIPEAALKDDEEDSVPEFIRRQRRIQERLAKEDILDFENRRSGYFTHVLLSPTSPNRQSFGATMSSPSVVRVLETPEPVISVDEEIKVMTNGNGVAAAHSQHLIDAEEEEVAKAIEEVNKAVEGEDYEYKDEQNVEGPIGEVGSTTAAVATTWEAIPEPTIELVDEEAPTSESVEYKIHEETKTIETRSTPNETSKDVVVTAVSVVTSLDDVVKIIDSSQTQTVIVAPNGEVATEVAQHTDHVEVIEVHAPQENGHDSVTISHTNGFDGPSIPAPDPSGVLGVNYDPKTVVSFSKDLGGEPNNYPDTVKVVVQNADGSKTPIDEQLQELTKLKFDIKADERGDGVQVTPVLRTD